MYTSFPRVNGEYNFTGYSAFFFIPTSQVTAVNVLDSIAAVTYTGDWYQGYSIQEKIFFKDDPASDEKGVNYPVTLSGTAPVDKPEYLHLFSNMVVDEFLVLIRDNNGRMKLLGTKEKGLRFLYKTEGVGYVFQFTGDYNIAPPFFTGNVTVDGTVIGSVLTPAGSYIRAARWILGTGAPGAGVGNQWDVYIDTITTDYYSKETGVWVLQGQLVDQALQTLSYMYSTIALVTGTVT